MFYCHEENEYRPIGDIVKDANSIFDLEEGQEKYYGHVHDLINRIVGRYGTYIEKANLDEDELIEFASLKIYERMLKFPFNVLKHIRAKFGCYITRYERETNSGLIKSSIYDPDLNLAINSMGGIVDRSRKEFRKIENLDSKRVLPVLDLVDYVMDKYCVFKDDTVLYKYLKLSLYISLSRTYFFPYYKLNKGFHNYAKSLYNAYLNYYSQLFKQEVILVDN